jgi:DDE superfamily endonuclease
MLRSARRGRWPSTWDCRSRWCRGCGGRSDLLRTNRIRGIRAGFGDVRGRETQIQALNRTQPVFPLLPGTPARAGQVIGSLHGRHRAVEFLAFLRKIDANVPADLDVHLVLDNASTHKTPAVKRWLTAHPRFVRHLTPTSSTLDQSGRTLVLGANHQETGSRHPHIGTPTQRRHSGLDRHLERQPAPLRLDEDCTRINDSGR